VVKQRISWVEIDIDYCSLTFGTAPCTAALSADVPRKCFQTFKTCASTANFTKSTKTMYLFPPVVGLPPMANAFPVLSGDITESDSTVNIAGSDPDISAFGKRATISFKVRDPKDSDTWFDKYWSQRISGAAQYSGVGYQPIDYGTLFTRLKARWPYFAGRECRRRSGWLEDGVLTIERTSYYLLTDFETDTPGQATIKGQDVLNVASNDKALCPKTSSGKLLAAITASATTATLTPTGIGDSGYAASGYLTIGSEIIGFIRSGDTLTLTTRGAFSTTAASHSASDAVQQAAYWDGLTADLVVADLLTNYAPVPTSYIDTAAWAAEIARGNPDLKITAIVTKPTAVSDLISEISYLGLSVYAESGAKSIGFKTSRPYYDDTTWTITDSDIIKDGLTLAGRDDKRLTEVVVNTVQKDPTQGVGTTNFLRSYYLLDGDAKGANAYADSKIKQMYIRWLNQGNDDLVRILAIRYLARFRSAPQRATVQVRADKYAGVKLTDVVFLTTDQITDEAGAPETRAYQVISMSKKSAGVAELQLQRYFYAGRYGRFVANDSPTYSAATDAQKAVGGWFSSETAPTFSPFIFV